jgi:hypothetical protein
MRRLCAFVLLAFLLSAPSVAKIEPSSSHPVRTPVVSTPPVRLLASDASGVTIEWTTPNPTMQPISDGFVTIRFEGSVTTGRTGEPELPAYRVMLGVPLNASVRVAASAGAARDIGSARVAPVPTPRVVRDAPDIQRVEPLYLTDAAAYRRADFMPSELAATVLDGMMRDRRVVQVEIRPIQYQPSGGRLRYYPRITVRVDFDAAAAGPLGTAFGRAPAESRDINDFFARTLLNDEASKNWRQGRRMPVAAPALEGGATTGIKIYASKEGVYRVTGRMLQTAGFDLNGVRPEVLRLTFLGKELPVYFRGEADGRFDADDYIEFYSTRPKTPYSIYNVFRLSAGTGRGMRVAEQEGAPRNALATLVPSFRSKVHLEENRLHSILQHVTPEDITPNDPHAWFEARDHWYWFGVKNDAEKNEVTQEFPLFDVARTFDPSRIDILLQGQTPVVHDALVHVNETKIARISGWEKQEERRVGRSLPSNALVDATAGMNVVRLARIDTNEDDDKDDYPYHFYVNWVDVEYTRLLRAVGETLAFSTPLTDKALDIRRRQTLEYAISDFFDGDIAIYETDGASLLARFRNVEVESNPMTPESRNRFRRYQQVLGSARTVPATLYTARFQVTDTHDAHYIAVSSSGVHSPDRLALDAPSELENSNNGADYIVIYHPWFVEAAQELAEWRRTPEGGGNRVVAVDVTDIYDEFGDGMVTPNAIKAFLSYAFLNWQAPAFRNVVIIADGTWDFYGVDKKRYPDAPEFMGYIPTHYVWSLFGQSAADHWFTTVSGIDSISDFFIGRLPVETPEQATAVVRKIIRYESDAPNGSWRRRIISVADDDTTNSGDFLFRQSLNDISQNHTLLGYETYKIFLEDIETEIASNRDVYKDLRASEVARKRIVDGFSDGAIIAQYAGHGGRQVWAHEIIFDNPGIATLRPTDRIPLLLVLSCFNGYFDAPVEPSMAESFLRLPNSGVIGMISATRLTFGSGNDALNKIIFDDIFLRNVRSFGEIAFVSKTRLLAEQGLSHLETMQQYMLFGDPATRLHLADYEIRPEVVERSVSPGGTLKIASGRILLSTYDRSTDSKTYEPVSDFTGRLVVTSRFVRRGSGNVAEVAAETTVSNGVYPEVTLNVPADIVSGRAQVEFYAESPTHLAVGGSSFSVSDPVLDAVEPSVKDGVFRLDVHVADDVAVASVRIEYYDRVKRAWTFLDLQPVPSRGAGWYRLTTAVTLPPPGENIEYVLHVRDDEGNETVTAVLAFTPKPLPDWRVLPADTRRSPLIVYEYDATDGWRLTAHIENLNDVRTEVPVPVTFYLGNPDADGDGILDADAKPLGVATIPPSAWVKSDPIGPNPNPQSRLRASETPLNSHWLAKATLKTTLAPGRHPVFVWIDASAGDDTEREEDPNNNLDGRVISVNTTLVTGGNATLRSLDGAFRVDLSGRAFATAQVVSVDEIGTPPRAQPLLTPFVSPSSRGAYAATTSLMTLQVPASVEFLVDAQRVRDDVMAQLGFADLKSADLKPDERALVENAVKTELASLALYRWLPDVERWRRVDGSAVQKDASQNPAYRLQMTEATPPERTGLVTLVALDSARVDVGEWVAVFTGPVTYDLYYRTGTEAMRRVAEGVAALGSTSAAIPPGRENLPFLVLPSHAATREWGTVEKFETGTNVAGTARLVVRNPRQGNFGSGVVEINADGATKSLDEDAWLILFVSDDTYEIRRRSGGVITVGNEPLRARVGETWRDPATGLTTLVMTGDSRFEAGDSFRFDSRTVVPVRGTTSSLGTFGVYSTKDKTPPIVEISVVGQDFHDGDPIPPKPRIHAVISDESGVDPSSVAILLSRNGAEFQPVPTDRRAIHTTPGTNQTLVEWTPELEPSDYDLRVTATDVEGLPATKQIPFRVAASSDLRSALNYPNPFRTHTDLAIEATGEMDTLAVTIYSLAGRVVRRLEHPPTAGFVRIRWDGRDADGREVANGVYYARVRMTARGKTLTETIKLLKMK